MNMIKRWVMNKWFLALFVGVVGFFVVWGYNSPPVEKSAAQSSTQTLITILNNVWDRVNHRLMTTPGVGAQGVTETEITIFNDVWDSANNMLRTSGGGGGGGDLTSNTALSVDGEVALFSGVTGKVLRRATGTGLASLAAGVLGTTNLSGDVSTSGSAVTTVTSVNGVAFPTGGLLNSVPVGIAANSMAYKVIPSCPLATGFLNFDNTTQTFSCGVPGASTGDVSAVGNCLTGACFTAAVPSANLTFNNATSGSVTLQTVTGALGAVTVSLPAATDTLVGKATADVLTNKTFNSESTGNVLTSSHKVWMPAAGCDDVTAALLWDRKPGEGVTASCITGTNITKGVAVFPDGVVSILQQTLLLPSDWTGVVDARLVWLSTAISGSAMWHIATGCAADDETDDNFNADVSVTDAAKGTTGRLNFATLPTLVTTNCAVAEVMHVAVYRNGSDAGDTMLGSASLVGVELTLRRAQ